jgi:kynurenine formamidase
VRALRRGLLALVLTGCGAAAEPPVGRLIDLSHPYGPETVYWPTDERGFQLETLAAGMTEGGYYYAANRFCSAEHGGTHLDAPVHFAQGRPPVDAIPLQRLVGPAVVVDVEQSAAARADYQVSLADLQDWESRHGRIPQGAIVLLRTGHGRHWSDPDRYLGTRRRGPEAVAELRFPGLHPEAARWLAEQRRVGSVGIDTPSIDHGPSKGFESHRALSEHEIPVFENLARLEELPARGLWVAALPMKIAGGSGGPLRAVAVVP